MVQYHSIFSYALPSLYVADTGAGVHLTNRESIGNNTTKHGNLLELHTANGVIPSTEVTHSKLDNDFGELEFRVLDETPNVLSVGRIVRQQRMHLAWGPDIPPHFITAQGVKIPLTVINDVPFFEKKFTDTVIKTISAVGLTDEQ